MQYANDQTNQLTLHTGPHELSASEIAQTSGGAMKLSAEATATQADTNTATAFVWESVDNSISSEQRKMVAGKSIEH